MGTECIYCLFSKERPARCGLIQHQVKLVVFLLSTAGVSCFVSMSLLEKLCKCLILPVGPVIDYIVLIGRRLYCKQLMHNLLVLDRTDHKMDYNILLFEPIVQRSFLVC